MHLKRIALACLAVGILVVPAVAQAAPGLRVGITDNDVARDPAPARLRATGGVGRTGSSSTTSGTGKPV